MTKELQAHPAANAFPMMDHERFAELKEHIRVHGLYQPIVLLDGKILDGRNRYKAIKELADEGIEIKYKPQNYTGNTPYCSVWGLNAQRRDLIKEQRAAIFVRMEPEIETELRAIGAEVEKEANEKRSEAAKERPRKSDGTLASAPSNRGGTGSKKTKKNSPKRGTAGKLAKKSGLNRSALERQRNLRKNNPKLADDVADGKTKPTEARRQLKKEQVSKKVEALPKNKYRIIYADPPWKYNDERGGLGSSEGQKTDRASSAALDHYPTMTNAEISALDVKSLAANDCVLLCWATFPLVPEQLEVVKAWGFKYKTSFIWDKTRGSFGHYHKAEAEALLVCTRGSCTPDAEKRENQIQRFPRAEHSRKPEEWRKLIDRQWTIGPRIELFRRGDAPKGWDIWGNEAAPELEAAA